MILIAACLDVTCCRPEFLRVHRRSTECAGCRFGSLVQVSQEKTIPKADSPGILLPEAKRFCEALFVNPVEFSLLNAR